MTNAERKQQLRKRTEQLDLITKPLRNIAWLAAFALAAWVQFLGPGMAMALREMSGSNELSAKMDRLFNKTDERLAFIEQNITPPAVALFNFNRQIGECTTESCRVLHNVSRTPYGEDCGVPDTKAYIRVKWTGQVFDLPYSDGFTETEATIRGRNIEIPFEISDLVPAGDHEYRFVNLYPSCGWALEPIPRNSPWFDITVTR